jgi:hypothetical protein
VSGDEEGQSKLKSIRMKLCVPRQGRIGTKDSQTGMETGTVTVPIAVPIKSSSFTSRRAVDMFKQEVLLEHTDIVISESQVCEYC